MTIPTAVAALEARANELMQAAPPANPDPAPAQGDTRHEPSKHEDAEYWRNRFGVLQGKYNAEVPALSERLRRLEAELEEAKRKPVEPVRVTTDEDREILGEQMDSIRRVAQEEMATKLAEQAEEIRQLREQLKGVAKDVGMSAWDTFLATMDRNFPPRKEGEQPYWRIVNELPEFMDWLNEPDPVSGRARYDGLKEATAACDHARASGIFNLFLNGNAPQPRPNPGSLNARITPPSAPRRTPDQGVSGRTWTRAEIAEFYAHKQDAEYRNRGPYAGQPEELKRIEADIFAAQKEGRVIG